MRFAAYFAAYRDCGAGYEPRRVMRNENLRCAGEIERERREIGSAVRLSLQASCLSKILRDSEIFVLTLRCIQTNPRHRNPRPARNAPPTFSNPCHPCNETPAPRESSAVW